MGVDLYPLRVLLATLAGWMNRQQQDVVAYLAEDNRALGSRRRSERRRRRRPCPSVP